MGSGRKLAIKENNPLTDRQNNDIYNIVFIFVVNTKEVLTA